MVASIRHFLRFIDLDSTFNEHGFVRKVSYLPAPYKLEDLTLSPYRLVQLSN